MTESFSKTRLSRARARLRELLGQHMNPGEPSGGEPKDTGSNRAGGSHAADPGGIVASMARSHKGHAPELAENAGGSSAGSFAKGPNSPTQLAVAGKPATTTHSCHLTAPVFGKP